MSQQYDVLRRPLITEKSTYQSNKLHQYAFEVDNAASRSEVKDVVEKAFNVTVVSVNIMNVPAKRGRRARSRKMAIRKPGYKKAIVTLAPDNRIPIFEGVEQ
jgi:large subunit ribosomal protein L23